MQSSFTRFKLRYLYWSLTANNSWRIHTTLSYFSCQWGSLGPLVWSRCYFTCGVLACCENLSYFMCILLGFLLLNESLCRLGYGDAKYNFHNAKDSYHSFIYRCCCFLRYFFRCWIFLAIPGDRFIWFSSFEVWWYFVLGFLCKSSGQFCFGDCLNWRSRRSVQLVSFFEVCL